MPRVTLEPQVRQELKVTRVTLESLGPQVQQEPRDTKVQLEPLERQDPGVTLVPLASERRVIQVPQVRLEPLVRRVPLEPLVRLEQRETKDITVKTERMELPVQQVL